MTSLKQGCSGGVDLREWPRLPTPPSVPGEVRPGASFQLLSVPLSLRSGGEEQVSSEITGLTENGGVITIDGFSSHGPAQQSGARVGWQLNLGETFELDVNRSTWV